FPEQMQEVCLIIRRIFTEWLLFTPFPVTRFAMHRIFIKKREPDLFPGSLFIDYPLFTAFFA
ncbi:MAG: hypothetical protein Q4G15_10815, partial [Lachnospiraceae bacterium]|nr:hypothetical protein [Lachnospiraceae bacterium]